MGMLDSEAEFISYLADSNRAIYIYGAGKYGDFLGQYFAYHKVDWMGYIDGDNSKQGEMLNDKLIYSLENVEVEGVLIIVSVLPFLNRCEDIYQTLENAGVKSCSIIRFSENVDLVRTMLWCVRKPEQELEKIKELKDKYLGQRCFLVGNGPSLCVEDLNKLSEELVFGCNAIFQILQHAKCRLAVYLFGDIYFVEKYAKKEEDICRLLEMTEYGISLFTSDVFDTYKGKFSNLYFIENITKKNHVWFETDVTKGVCESGTSLYLLMQLAVYMGIKEIYLLGTDFSFQKEIRQGKLVINNDCQNHASEMDQEPRGMYDIDYITAGFLCAKEFADNNGIKLYNATRGGKLEIFERIDFDSLF